MYTYHWSIIVDVINCDVKSTDGLQGWCATIRSFDRDISHLLSSRLISIKGLAASDDALHWIHLKLLLGTGSQDGVEDLACRVRVIVVGLDLGDDRTGRFSFLQVCRATFIKDGTVLVLHVDTLVGVGTWVLYVSHDGEKI